MRRRISAKTSAARCNRIFREPSDVGNLLEKSRATERAFRFGEAAFKAGKMRVPAQDVDFCALLHGADPGESIALLNAWLRAWDRENLEH